MITSSTTLGDISERLRRVNTPAARRAYLRMVYLASQMGACRRSDPVRYADLRTSMCDLRAALALATGHPAVDLGRDGHVPLNAPGPAVPSPAGSGVTSPTAHNLKERT